MFKKFIKKYFDYDIVGEVLEYQGNGRWRTRYIREYYPKFLKKFRKKKRGGHR